MSEGERELRDKAARASAAGESLWRAGVARRAAWLADGLARLSTRDAAFADQLSTIAESAGLSLPMAQWALESTLSAYTAQALESWEQSLPLPNARARRARPGALCVVILAGNVFTAAVRGVALPLLLGIPVLVRPSDDDAAFVQWLTRALHEADAALGESLQWVRFPSRDAALSDLLLAQGDTLVAYGSDSTLQALRARLDPRVGFVGHGHGLGAAFVGAAALQAEDAAREAARALAFDVAAYDQRGCMSPLATWVAIDQPISPEAFAALLFEALLALGQSLPRGPLPLDVASAQLGFRAVGSLCGRLFEGDGCAVSYEAEGPLRISPGHRNVQVLDVASEAALMQVLAPLGVHLKCLGVAGASPAARLASSLPARVAPRICALGRMQLPRLDALQDGVSAWEGLLRYTECDSD
jgi:hypothetical protein